MIREIKHILVLVVGILFLPILNYSQTGPSGILINSEYDLLYQAERYRLNDGDAVSVTRDLSGTIVHDGASVSGEEPIYKNDALNTVNGYPVLLFDGVDDVVRISNNTELNDSDFTKKSLLLSFKTSPDIISRQVIYEQGDAVDGLNVYILNSRLYIGGYSDNGSSWSIYNDTIIEASTPYVIYLELNEASNTFTTYLNAIKFGINIGADTLGRSSGAIGLGNVNFNTQFHDVTSVTTYPFSGSVMDFISVNKVLNNTQRIILLSHFGGKYAIDLPIGYYDFHEQYSDQIIGIGADNTSGDNSFSAQDTLAFLTIEPLSISGINAGDYFYLGGNRDSISQLSFTETPYDSIYRCSKEWILNLKGSADTFKLTIDTNYLGTRPPGYTKFAVLVDDDGDFTAGTKVYEMYSPSADQFYVIDSIPFLDGQYITFARVKPIISFTSQNDNDFESINPARLSLVQNIILRTDLSVNYNAFDVTALQSPAVGFDYDNFSGIITIPKGAFRDTIDITIISDGAIEAEETFDVKLTGENAGGFDSTRYTINGDDNPVKVFFTWLDSSNVESEDTIYAEVQLSQVHTLPVTVEYEVTGGTAISGGVDYTITGSILTFAPGIVKDTILILVNDDDSHELKEDIDFRLLNITNANLDNDSTVAQYSIVDNDLPIISFVDSSRLLC